MRKDYAKYRSGKMKKSHPHGWRQGVWWVIFVLLICIGVGLYWVFSHPNYAATVKTSFALWKEKISTVWPHKKGLNHAPPSAQKPAVVSQRQEVHFEFYDELARVKTAATAEEPASPLPNNDMLQQYISNELSTAAVEDVDVTSKTVAQKKTEKTISDHALKQAFLGGKHAKKLAADLRHSPAHTAHSAAHKKNSLPAKVVPNHRYILQLGAFSDSLSASKLRVSLMLAGVEAGVVKIRAGKKILYSVQHGPYVDMKVAEVTQRKLQQKGFESVVKKEHV